MGIFLWKGVNILPMKRGYNSPYGLTPFRFTIYKSLVLQNNKVTKIESNEYLNNITICQVQIILKHLRQK